MSDQRKIHVPEGVPGTGMTITGPGDIEVTALDWAAGLCELHCREDRCCYGCDCPGHQPDGTHVVQTNSHEGMHGWLEHDGYPLHSHNPVTHSIRWATKEEIERRGTVQCGRWGCVLPAGHNTGQPDIPENHKSDKQLRDGRCPDGGYCHGSSLAAGSPPCAEGRCLRVHTSGPLSGVFPGDRWPPEVLRAAGLDGEPPPTVMLEISQTAMLALTKPDGSPMVAAIHLAAEVTRHLQAAMGSRDLREAQAELAMAAALIESLDDNIVTAQHNIGDALREAPQPPPE